MAQIQCTILFVDIAGSTKLYEQLGDTHALQVVEQVLKLMAAITAKFKGRVVKTIGDELMCLFADATSGLQAASEMQTRLAQHESPDNLRLAVRIAFHHGQALEENGDVFGDTVNVAARLAALAQAGQVLTSWQTVDCLPQYLRLGVRQVDRLKLRGKEESLDVFEVIWDFNDDLTMVQGRPAPVEEKEQLHLALEHEGKTLQAGDRQPTIQIGRDPGSDIVIADRMASRRHARIELRRGKFVYIDISSNGSFIQFDDGEQVLVKREEITLLGSGIISFGRNTAQGAEEVIHFRLKAGPP